MKISEWTICLVVLIVAHFDFTTQQGTSSWILLANLDKVERMEIDTWNTTTLVGGMRAAIAVDFHWSQNYIYWSDQTEDRIRRMSLSEMNGEPEDLITNKLEFGDSIAVDWIYNHLYFIDAQHDYIKVCELNGTLTKTLIDTDLSHPRDLVVYPEKGLMFFADVNFRKIEKCGLDGSNRQTIVSGDSLIYFPYALAIDFSTDRLYWIDHAYKTIRSSTLQGTDIQLLASSPENIHNPFGLAIYGDWVYWTSYTNTSIHRVKKSTGLEFETIAANMSGPLGIKIFSQDNQPTVVNLCGTNNGGCAQLCLPTSQPSFTCACADGFRLNSDFKTCTHIGSGYWLTFVNHFSVDRLDLGTNVMETVAKGLTNGVDLDIHYTRGYVYWSDVVSKKISRTSVTNDDVSNVVEDIITDTIDVPDGIAIDWINDLLFWTDTGLDHIQVSRLDGSYRKTILKGGTLDQPRAIVVDPTKGWIFFSDWGSNPRIERCKYDGRDRTTIISSDIQWANGMSLDINNGRLYWIDGFLNQIKSTTYDGSSTELLIKDINKLPKPFDLAVFNGVVYWSNWEFRSISKINTNKLGYGVVANHIRKPMGLKVYGSGVQTGGSNVCNQNNGGCSHICFPMATSITTASTTSLCMCPDYYEMQPDNKTCIEIEPPLSLRISSTNGKVNISWTLPTIDGDYLLRTELQLFYDSGSLISVQTINYPGSYYSRDLQNCNRYTVKLRCYYSRRGWSPYIEEQFWPVDNLIYTEEGASINVSWSTVTYRSSYNVAFQSQSGVTEIIYSNGVLQQDSSKYSNLVKNGLQISFTLHQAKESDAGLYKSTPAYSTSVIDGCGLLVKIGGPVKPKLTYDKYPFVGDNVTFTCSSQIERVPKFIFQYLSYTWYFNGALQNTPLFINSVSKSDTGKTVSCTATDDRGQTSVSSDVIMLDPFYGPDDVQLSIATTDVNVTVGNQFGPILCNASCYPKCNFKWQHLVNENYTEIVEGQNLTLLSTDFSDSGDYVCVTTHQNDTSRSDSIIIKLQILATTSTTTTTTPTTTTTTPTTTSIMMTATATMSTTTPTTTPSTSAPTQTSTMSITTTTVALTPVGTSTDRPEVNSQQQNDTTTDTSTNSAAVTTTISTTTVPTTQSTPTTTPCPSTGVLNRTNKVLDEECGEYGSDSKCIVENSGCMQSYTDRVWRCRCARGYVKMNQQCVQNPGRIFSSRGPLVKTIRGDTPIGETVFTIDRSEISGFLLENTQPLEIIGEKSTMFSTEISSNSIIVKVNGNLETRKYNLFLFASVQIDDSGLNDFVEMQITVTPESLIPEDIIILDGTPKGVVVGHLCDSCLSESTQPTVENSDLVKVNNDGSIVTTRLVSIDTLQSQVTIAYSTDIHVRIENNFRINITLTIARAQYTIQLNEDSTSSTQVGILNLQHSFQLQNDEFQVNGNSLNLGSKTNLDYEQKTEVTKSLSFSLTGKTTHTINIVINIKVINVNDEVPKFTQTMYSFRSVQTAYTDLVIGFVLANDPDSGSQLQYSTTPSDVLTVDNNGVVSIIKSVSSRTYNATVDVRDGKYSDTAKIFIEFLQPTNVNLGKEFTGTIAENKPSGTYVTSASEPGYNNFQFTDQVANNHFSIDSVTGQIASTRSFDRENEGDRSFKYTVVANKENEASCSLVVIGEVIITITDENDEPPVFVNTHYNATVIEEATGIVLTMSTAISTSDKDLNPTVSYSLSGFHASKFSIEAATGIMKTIQAIDREIIPSLDVNVVANDGKNTASAVVYVTIADINDNPPKFSSTSYSFSVDENVPSGTQVNEVIATDADIGKNAVLTFDIISDGGYFRINQTTGEITVNGDLDRETLETYNVTVIARDNGDTINSADVTVSITVKDVNDNPPVFPNDRITINFEENKSCNTPITTIKATDADKQGTTNSLITYTLLSGTDKFTIDGNSGELKCISLIDYESDKSFTVYVRAEDRATSGKLSSNLTVIIQITDVNDNSPQFMDPRSSLTIRYFTSQSRVIDAFSVTDKDSAENGMITMSVAGTASAFLEIDNNGILRTIVNTNPINKQYNLVVTAVDHGNPQLSATHTLNVTVNKDTTHVVTFEDQVMGMTVMENSGIGTSVGEVASNVKLSQTGITLEYEIWDEDDEISFSISSSSGIITSKKLIDREEIAEHEFVVRVKNAASDEQSDLAVVHIDITDVNDNPPIFERDNYYYTISENSEPDHQVQPASVKVKASDQDTGENAAIEYKIIERAGCKSKFKLRTEADGSQAIVLANKIDYEEIRTCEFAIKAENTNNNSMSSTTEIDVNILDYNDNAPEFLDHDNNVYMLDVPEDTTINTEILPFGGLQDKDSRENGDIILSIVNKDCTFDASNEGMRIKVKLQSGASLDYESGHRSYICLLKAEDRGQPVMSSSATLSISVTDVNDNKPMISNAVFSVNVSRESDPGYIIVNSISASDADSGDNGKLVYSIQGSAYSSNFKIDVDTGKISINSPLTSIQEDQIVLRVIVADKGIPRLESLAQVTIFIKDDNPRPYLEPTNPIRIQENTLLPEGIITTVKAFDRKNGKETICDCTFTLQSTNRDDIVIDNTTGVIRFKNRNGYFDRENEPNGQVSVVVIATDKDDPPKDSRPGVVRVIIGDMNDQFPIFTEQQYNFEVFQKAPVGTFVGRVSAVDRDMDPITHYSIQISSSIFTQSVLSIDQLTGEITKTGNLTLDQTANFQLQAYVYAADSKDPAKNATFANVIVTILFDDKNNHTPKFQQESYKSTLDWSAPPGTTVVEIIATDDDTEEEGIVSYSIVSGNDRGFFAVDGNGKLTLVYQLDSSLGTGSQIYKTLIVKAMDGGVIPKSSTASILVTISGENPGVSVQGTAHSKALNDSENERQKWSTALYVLVALLCIAILCSLFLLYKWRTAPAPSSDREPFDTDKRKYFSNEQYSDLGKRNTVEYSQSNDAFVDPYNRPTDEPSNEPIPDYPVYDWQTQETRVLPAVASNQT